MLTTLIMFAILEGLYIIHREEEESAKLAQARLMRAKAESRRAPRKNAARKRKPGSGDRRIREDKIPADYEENAMEDTAFPEGDEIEDEEY